MKQRETGWELESGSGEEKNNVRCDADTACCSLQAGLSGAGEKRDGGWG